jgi:hypothetical protein
MKRFTNKQVFCCVEPLSKAGTEIDDGIRTLVLNLNSRGYGTISSCQRRTKKSDSHCPHAFVTFECILTQAFIRRIEREGLEVYNGGVAVSSMVDEDTPDEMAIVLNSHFNSQMRSLFFG